MSRRLRIILIIVGPILILVVVAILVTRSADVVAQPCNSWHVLSGQEIDSDLQNASFGVVAALASDDVWLGGTSGRKLVFGHWNGSRLQAINSPAFEAPNIWLTDMDFNTSDDGWAIGEYEVEDPPPHEIVNQPFAIHWDGVAWKVFPIPTSIRTNSGELFPLISRTSPQAYIDTRLESVAALADGDAWAVGSFCGGQNDPCLLPVILHWDGRKWDSIESPVRGRLETVVALAAHDVWAFGDLDNVDDALHWDGRSWKVSDALSALSNITHATVSREGDIVVLGWMTAYNSQSGGFTHYRRRGLGIQTRDSKDWHMIELPEVEEAQNVVEPEVTGISASSENDVWIVGYYPANYGDDYFPSPLRYARQFVLHWDGQTWHEMPAPNPTDKHLLHDVAMAARGNVWAVERQGWGLGEREHIPGMAAFYVECATSATPVLGVSK